ncbi:MAG: hypothetical protein P1V36_12145, partial [Planctomycetota bacterium]|nr:hypothetical protein [Planctomycetota bacterium]
MAPVDEPNAWLRLALAEPPGGRLPGARRAAALGGARAALGASQATLVELVGRDRAGDLRAAWRRARPAAVRARAARLEQRVLTPADPGWPVDA